MGAFRTACRSSGIGIGFERADVGSAGVADGVAPGPGAGSRDGQTDQLPDDLASISMPEAVSEHRDVAAYVRNGHRLAEHVRALQMSPLVLDVGPVSRGASPGSFSVPVVT